MHKFYLNVDYSDRELAKRLGARWDPAVKKWYCAPDSPLAKIYSWRRAPVQMNVKTRKESISINLTKHGTAQSKAISKLTTPMASAPACLESLPLFA